MAYLYENQELVYEMQMTSLKKRIIFVNSVIFISNFIATLILILNEMQFINFLHIVLPVFVLNLLISYAVLINKDSNEQLYLAMYISIIGTIVVMFGIFLNVKNPTTYMLIYLSIAIISVFKDKKAVGLGYLLIFIFGSIINFMYADYIIVNNDSSYANLMPYLYEGILVIILLVQAVRTYYNYNEIEYLYTQLETQKELELKYHKTIFNLINENLAFERYTDNYVNDETKERLYKYLDLYNDSFLLKADLKQKLERYLDLQAYKTPHKVLGRRLGSYLLRKELNNFEEL